MQCDCDLFDVSQDGRGAWGGKLCPMHAKLIFEGAEAERMKCWEQIDDLIKDGDLPEPAHSQRNGLVLACNAIHPDKQ